MTNSENEALTLASLKSEIEALQADIKSNKRQNLSLKVMLYVGIIVLMLGFFYSSGMFKQTQADNVEANFYNMRNRVNHELLQIQKSLFGEILRLQEELENVSSKGPSPAELKDIINRMNVSVESLQSPGIETEELGEEIRQHSEEFLKVYEQHIALK
ncbi:MAG: hypothetical protein ACQ9MH_08670 [Nitrospinales bacterium]